MLQSVTESYVDGSDAPAQTVFSQQKIDAWRPLLKPVIVVSILIASGLLFLVIGISLFVTSKDLFNTDIRYDNVCENLQKCVVNITIPKDLSKGHIFLSYRLTNFPQNHNRYLNSKSDDQLRGEYVTYDDTSSCGDFRGNRQNWTIPCGAIACSFFNDTFKWIGINFTENGISWRSDRRKLFRKSSDKYENRTRWLETAPFSLQDGQRNEHFIVWMRLSTLPTLIKPYSRCTDPVIKKGVYQIEIENNYPTSLFNGEKHVVVSEVGILGMTGKQLGIAYMVTGSVFIVSAVLIIVSRLLYPRRLGDMSGISSRYITQS